MAPVMTVGLYDFDDQWGDRKLVIETEGGKVVLDGEEEAELCEVLMERARKAADNEA